MLFSRGYKRRHTAKNHYHKRMLLQWVYLKRKNFIRYGKVLLKYGGWLWWRCFIYETNSSEIRRIDRLAIHYLHIYEFKYDILLLLQRLIYICQSVYFGRCFISRINIAFLKEIIESKLKIYIYFLKCLIWKILETEKIFH